ncbi:hypothetical protein Rmet_5485 (plasmid) [Cupriavidus metallidurans CH34]|uniref:Uncharacterized protein n=1 Tax=Cupriavidus metallidurans (strain ATCC 43123 / DSM 2839 / NBRC 102507 / CH34) TaxID=266264 RepID=Q1LBY2_CUPMC|nr:hypothetical protein Rmet_5485 [Cupriavidus metallidurans CH34]
MHLNFGQTPIARLRGNSLCCADYIRCRETLNDDVFVGAQLTAQGLVTLNSVPRSIDGIGSLGRRMKSALSGGAKHVVGKLAEEAISAGFQLMTRGMLP